MKNFTANWNIENAAFYIGFFFFKRDEAGKKELLSAIVFRVERNIFVFERRSRDYETAKNIYCIFAFYINF